jgi:hypothetical protein
MKHYKLICCIHRAVVIGAMTRDTEAMLITMITIIDNR